MKIFLVDGFALLYRSHFAFAGRHLTSTSGEMTSAAFGVANGLVRLREEEGADAIVVAFDVKGPTFRHELYADYKAHRPPMPPELAEQIPRVREVVEALDIPIVELEGFEADDVIGTLAREGAEAGHEMWIYSGDKDFIPLVREGVGILKPASRGGKDSYLDERAVVKSLRLKPRQYLDALALMGDKADNVPGVPGVGEKTALKLVAQFGDLDALLEDLENKKLSPSVRKKLSENREQLELSRRLVTIDEKVPVELDLKAARVRPYGEAFVELCRRLEFTRLLERVQAEPAVADSPPASVGGGDAVPTAPPGVAVDGSTTTPSATADDGNEERRGAGDRDYRLLLTLDALDAALAQLDEHPVWSLDTETTSLDPMQAELVGISLSAVPGRAFYVPVDVEADVPPTADLFDDGRPQRLRWQAVRERLAPIFEDSRRGFVGQNLKYDQLVLARHGAPVGRVDFDTMIASHLLAPERRQHNLDALAQEILGVSTVSYKSMFEGMESKDIRDLPLERLSDYAAEDADIALRLSLVFRDALLEHELDHLLSDVEIPLSQVLMRMENRGVKLDVPLLNDFARQLGGRMKELMNQCWEVAGTEFNLNSPKQLQSILFERIGLKPVKKTATGYSTDVDVLTRLAEQHELPRLILEYRQISKLLSTYAEALPKLVNPETGCVHTSYNQAVAATGRLSSTDPNLQNIPVRSELGRRIRQAFVPREEGWCLLAADYSQIELRLMAHFSADSSMTAAFARGEDIHATTAAQVAGVALDEVDSDMRRRAKAINFGILYGMGARALAQQIDVPTKEAQAFIDQYFARFPRVRAWIDDTIRRAREEGEVRTILGRRRPVPEIHSTNPMQRAFGERIAVNTPIQGSAADLIKVAMIELDRRVESEDLPVRLLLQVHDELVLEVPVAQKEAMAEVVIDTMENVFDLSVPLSVDHSFGANWAEAKA